MFERLAGEAPVLQLTFEGQIVPFRAGDSVAAALLAAGVTPTRHSPVDGGGRAPYCMMGVCFECEVLIGAAKVRACLTPAEPGMAVSRQSGGRVLK